MKPFLTVYGHVCLDQIMALEQFPEPNTSVDIAEKHRYFGGTGANIATLSASLGVPTALVSYVGNDLPDEFKERMASCGVDLTEMIVVDGYETPTVTIITDSKQNQIAFVYQGPMRHMDDFEILASNASKSEIIHISTGRPDYYIRLMEELSSIGKEISFDPAQEIHHIWTAEKFARAISLADNFFCNANELRTALRHMNMHRPEELLEKVSMIINTRGEEGTIVYTAEESRSIPIVPSDAVIDPTGAGDAFRAGYYAGCYYGHSTEKCLAYGNAAASIILEAKGAVGILPTWKLVKERAKSLLETL